MQTALRDALRVLAGAGVDLDAEEILDILWLARGLPTDDSPLRTALALAFGADHRTGHQPNTHRTRAAGGGVPRRPPHPRNSLHSAAGTADERALGKEADNGGRAVRVPENKALHDELAIGRALRPLKRSRNRPDGVDLDEPATAAAWADTGMPTAVMRPLREPWLRCTLVVDDGVSMLIWRRHVLELGRLLTRIGGMRQVRLLGMRSRGPGPVRLRRRPFEEDGPLLGPEAAADPTGQTLVLLVTDGAGAAWRDGRMRQVLDVWGRSGPTAIVHTLPRWLWQGSGVPAHTVPVRTEGPGAPNTAWRIAGRPAAAEPVPVPVTELSPATLGDWATLLASTGGEGRIALWADSSAHRGDGDSPASAGSRPTGNDIERFLTAATPGAHRLAAHLAAAAPLSVPVMRLVQSAGLGGAAADAGTLAEVFLSGIMHRTAPAAADEATQRRTPMYYRQFDFHPTVKELLLHTVPTAELLEVRQRVSVKLEQLAGRSPEFPAWLAGGGATPLSGEPFAWAGSTLLGRADLGSALQVSQRPVRPAPPVAELDPSPQTQPYFFLSYAHTPQRDARAGDPNHWVAKFYTDVCEAITQLTDVPEGTPIGFMDQSMHAGEAWADRLSKELASCRVFVPLYSPRYFTSTTCGQEWHTFSQRTIHRRSQDGAPASAIVPVLWVAMDHYTLPRCANELQFNHAGFGADYSSEGLYALLKLSAFQQEYELAVHRIAERIVEVANETVSPVSRLVPFDQQPNAFTDDGPGVGTQLRLLVLAPTEDEAPPGLGGGRYGPRCVDWAPYSEPGQRPLAVHAAAVLRDAGFQVTVHELDGPFSDLPGDDNPTVVLVDQQVFTDPQLSGLRRRLPVGRALEVIEVVGHGRPAPLPGLTDSSPHGARRVNSQKEFDRVLLETAERAVSASHRFAANSPRRPRLPRPPVDT